MREVVKAVNKILMPFLSVASGRMEAKAKVVQGQTICTINFSQSTKFASIALATLKLLCKKFKDKDGAFVPGGTIAWGIDLKPGILSEIWLLPISSEILSPLFPADSTFRNVDMTSLNGESRLVQGLVGNRITVKRQLRGPFQRNPLILFYDWQTSKLEGHLLQDGLEDFASLTLIDLSRLKSHQGAPSYTSTTWMGDFILILHPKQ